MEKLEDRFLTTKQVATLLHVKERKVYELAAAGQIPGTRALGKWLFERAALDNWLKDHGPGGGAASEPEVPDVLLGSHDPLLDWALRESSSGIAAFYDGSMDGLDRFARGEGIAAGLHIHDPQTDTWNIETVKTRFADQPVVLAEWAWRWRGLIVEAGNPLNITRIEHLASKRVVPRQEGAGSQQLLEHLLARHLPGGNGMTRCKPARTENDAAVAVLEDEAQAAFGLQCVAQQYRLDFVPIVKERFDLLVRRRDWFEPPFQRLLEFMRSDEMRGRAVTMSGYDLSGAGTVHFNGR